MTIPLHGVASLNLPRLGQAGSRTKLETPAAVLDLDIFERNLARLAETCARHGVSVRPHAKSHKCATIAKRQIAAGALGVCCAKPGELLALAEAGVNDLLLTAPVASVMKIDALARMAARGVRIGVVVDRIDLVHAYAESAQRNSTMFDVLIDLDIGLKRSGVATAEEAVRLARAVAAHPSLRYAGVQAYHGRLQHIEDFAARKAENNLAREKLSQIIEALTQEALAPTMVSGGGTGSHLLDAAGKTFTEVQAGSYVFMDEGYLSVDIDGSGEQPFGPALRIAVTVIGHSSEGFAITDGGSKSFALDGPAPHVLLSERSIGRIEFCGDEFGRILPSDGEAVLPIGTVVECTVPHCDPTINLHDFLHVAKDDRIVEFWPVEARGRAD